MGLVAVAKGHHTVWRMMGEDTYAMAMEPSTSRDAGRWDAKERGELQHMEPGQTREYDLEIGALVGEKAIDHFETRVGRLASRVGRPALESVETSARYRVAGTG